MALMATAFGTKIAIAALSLVAIGGGTAVAAVGAPAADAPDTVQSDTATPTSTPTSADTETPAATADPTEAPDPTTTVTATKGPDATGPAAFGLCTAFTAGGLHNTSVAWAALLSASQSAGGIAEYCAPILAAHGHGPTSEPTPATTSDNSTTHGQSGTAHGHGASGSHGH